MEDLKVDQSKVKTSNTEKREAEEPKRHVVNLGDLAALTDGAGRQYVDGRKDSERQ